jgi:hypothetical protein
VSDNDWDPHRVLCPDGACTGIVGPDGICKVCGAAVPNWGNDRMRGLQEEPEDADEDEGPDDEEQDEVADQVENEVEAEGEWSERKLCDDGACVGVIGADGICTVCGRQSAA